MAQMWEMTFLRSELVYFVALLAFVDAKLFNGADAT